MADLFNCKLNSELVGEALLDSFTLHSTKSLKGSAYRLCMAGTGDGRTLLEGCVDKLEQPCRNSRLRVQKTLRLPGYMLERLWRVSPEVKIVYYVRDPRAILLSRSPVMLKATNFTGGSDIGPVTRQAALRMITHICDRMRDDIKWSKVHAERHPGTLLTVRYEDLAGRTVDTVNRLYDFVGLRQTTGVWTWLAQMTTAKVDGHAMDTIRKNSTRTAAAWREKVSPAFNAELVSICDDVLTELGYARNL